MRNFESEIWINTDIMKTGDSREFFPSNNSSERLTKIKQGFIYTFGDIQGTSTVFIPDNN